MCPCPWQGCRALLSQPIPGFQPSNPSPRDRMGNGESGLSGGLECLMVAPPSQSSGLSQGCAGGRQKHQQECTQCSHCAFRALWAAPGSLPAPGRTSALPWMQEKSPHSDSGQLFLLEPRSNKPGSSSAQAAGLLSQPSHSAKNSHRNAFISQDYLRGT